MDWGILHSPYNSNYVYDYITAFAAETMHANVTIISAALAVLLCGN